MRSYLDIFIDVQDGKDVDKEELRVALMFCRDMLFFSEQDIKRLVESIRKDSGQLLQANFVSHNLEDRIGNRKAPLEKWWGGVDKIPTVNKI